MDGTAPLTDSGTTWELLDANGRVLATKYNPEVSFLAAAGSYTVRLKLGTAQAEQSVQIDAGKTTAQSVSLGAGIIEASGVFSAGGPAVPDSATIELLKGEAGLDGKHEWITTTYGSSTQFKVPAGKYMVAFAKDYARGSAMVDVTAAGVAKVRLTSTAAIWRFPARRIQPLKSSPPRRTFQASASTSRPSMAVRSTRLSLRGPTMWLPNPVTARCLAKRNLR